MQQLQKNQLSYLEIETLTDRIVDPLNRYYRYPVSQLLFRWFGSLSITPNQVTIFHTLFSLLGAYSIGTSHFFIAFLIYEIRMILDCYDGLLARKKNLCSPYGRIIDALGDLVAMLGMLSGSFFYLTHFYSKPEAAVLVIFLGIIITQMAGIHDFYKRKIKSALKTQTDEIAEEAINAHFRSKQSLLSRLTNIADRIQIKLLSPETGKMIQNTIDSLKTSTSTLPIEIKNTREVQHLLAISTTQRFKYFSLYLSCTGGDNALGILNLGLLTGFYQLSIFVSMIYGIILSITTYICFRKITPTTS